MSSIGLAVHQCLCTVIHILLDSGEKVSYLLRQLVNTHLHLFRGITPYHNAYSVFDVSGSNLHTKRNAAHLLLREFKARALIRVIHLHAEVGQHIPKLISLLQHTFLALLNRNNANLRRRNLRRNNQTAVVSVHHNHRTDYAGRHAPGCLPYVLELVILIRKGDVIGLCKFLSEEMAGAGLQSTSVMHQCLNGVRGIRTGKLFFFGFLSLDGRNRHVLCQEIRIDVQHLLSPFFSFFLGRMDGMSLLPKELTGTKKRPRFLFPAHNRAPLIVQARKITIGVNIILVEIRKHRFGCRSYAQALRQRLCSARRHPGHLRRKAVHKLTLLCQKAFRNQHRHIHVLNTGGLEAAIEMIPNCLPKRIAGRLENREALNMRISDQFRLCAYIGVPLCEVLVH